jgi:hypothetical protein
MPACEHMVQIYDKDERLVEALQGFASSGLREGEGVIVIATAAHLHELEQRLRSNWLEPDRARYEGKYLPLLAPEVLSRFMINDWPDEGLFNSVAGEVLAQVRGPKRMKVRAFGEMVALLWADGHRQAALRLEFLWDKVIEREKIQLLCAYPRAGFGIDGEEAIRQVHAAHSRTIPA